MTDTVPVCALILAAGRGVRFGATENKVFVPLMGRPLLAWTLEAFAQCPDIDAIFLIGSNDDMPRLTEIGERYGGGKLRGVVVGGSTRQESARNGLAACADYPIVAVHDAARPCITSAIIAASIETARTYGAATVAYPVADTLIEDDGAAMGRNVDRSRLWSVQTPQTFRTDLLRQAHAMASQQPPQEITFTDDAGMMRLMDIPVRLVTGSPENLKVTRPEDLALAEAILARRQRDTMIPTFRIGHGYDVHPFAEGRKLYLGGVEFPDAPQGLLGHSDADVILHALCDALLGAAGMGDIGILFPPSDMRHKDRRSTEFLAEVKTRLDSLGWKICNVDITVLAETPKIGPKSGEIRDAISVILSMEPEQIGLKATTNEGLGFIGRGEGIAVHATALLARF